MERYHGFEEYLGKRPVNESTDLDVFFEQLQTIKAAKVIAFTPSNTPAADNCGKLAKVIVFSDALEEMREASAVREYKIRETYIKQRIDFEMKIRQSKIQKINEKINALLKSELSELEDVRLDIIQREFFEHTLDDDFENQRMKIYDNQEN